MECPVCFASNNGAYLFTECGHSICPNCIIRMHEISAHLRCPMCRVSINRAPVIVQAFASHMPEGLVRTMAQNFANWFIYTNESSNASNASNDINPLNYSTNINDIDYVSETNGSYANDTIVSQNLQLENPLIDAAAQEWNIITNNESFNTNNSITDIEFTNNTHNLPNNWTFRPFTRMYTLDTSRVNSTRQLEFVERMSPNQRRRFRRVVIYLDNNRLVNEIQNLENNMFTRYSTLRPFSELGLRNNRYTIYAYSLNNDFNEPLINRSINIKLVCRGVWTHNGQVGCRWFVSGLYN